MRAQRPKVFVASKFITNRYVQPGSEAAGAKCQEHHGPHDLFYAAVIRARTRTR
ncbi:hypothetical protein HY629_01405 [Candidatus Uhrbacteria bacterium]|nr:hypothetical protein [Candidatus Uhrbacteria bacterium]